MPPTATASATLLDRAAAALAAQERAAVDLLVAAADWAAANVVSDPLDAAGWEDKKLYSEGVSLLAGPGAPMISEFAPLEFAGRLGWSAEAGKRLIADALELKHRLPRLWALVLEQVVSARVARDIAHCTTDLSFEAAKQADRMVCADPARIGRVKAERLVDEIRLWFDPDRARDDEQRALAARGVWKQRGRTPATTDLLLTLDTSDAERFDASVARIAAVLRGLGDTDDLDIRRAKAVGVLANPQQALDLLAGRQPKPMGQSATLFVHMSEETFFGHDGPAVIEGLGAMSMDLLREWLGGSTVIIRPVLDLARDDVVDQHDPPAWMRELVIERDAHCVFPGCRRDSRSCDLDHITPYDTGGPTAPDNLSPLCRTHHRAKTHANFDYQRNRNGTYSWIMPSGTRADVTPNSRQPITP